MSQNSQTRKLTLPTDSRERKNYPLYRGLLRYFPAALAGVANTSKIGNDKHNPGQDLHHSRGKSNDHGDCILRHLMDFEDLFSAYERGEATQAEVLQEANCVAWRGLSFAQEVHELLGAPLAPGAKAKELPVPKSEIDIKLDTIEDQLLAGKPSEAFSTFLALSAMLNKEKA